MRGLEKEPVPCSLRPQSVPGSLWPLTAHPLFSIALPHAATAGTPHPSGSGHPERKSHVQGPWGSCWPITAALLSFADTHITYTCMHAYIYKHTYAHIHKHVCAQMYTHACIHAHGCICMCAHTCTSTHALCAHVCVHAHTESHMSAHTHPCKVGCSVPQGPGVVPVQTFSIPTSDFLQSSEVSIPGRRNERQSGMA